MATATKTPKAPTTTMLKITLKAGLIGKKQTQRAVVRALGLGKYGSSVMLPDTPTIRGMVNKIEHLLCVAPANSDFCKSSKAPTPVEEVTSTTKKASSRPSKKVTSPE